MKKLLIGLLAFGSISGFAVQAGEDLSHLEGLELLKELRQSNYRIQRRAISKILYENSKVPANIEDFPVAGEAGNLHCSIYETEWHYKTGFVSLRGAVNILAIEGTNDGSIPEKRLFLDNRLLETVSNPNNRGQYLYISWHTTMTETENDLIVSRDRIPGLIPMPTKMYLRRSGEFITFKFEEYSYSRDTPGKVYYGYCWDRGELDQFDLMYFNACRTPNRCPVLYERRR